MANNLNKKLIQKDYENHFKQHSDFKVNYKSSVQSVLKTYIAKNLDRTPSPIPNGSLT